MKTNQVSIKLIQSKYLRPDFFRILASGRTVEVCSSEPEKFVETLKQLLLKSGE